MDISKTVKKALPAVMTALSAVGVAATAVLAVRATPKALRLIDERQRAKSEEALTTAEKVKAAWVCYIPAAITGAATVACIVGSTVLTRRQQAALAGAYALLNSQYREYQDAVKARFGSEAHREIVREMTAEKAVKPSICAPGLVSCSSLDFAGADEEELLFYDFLSGRYFQSTISGVLQAEYHLNRNFALGAEPSMNDFYELLGISGTEDGDLRRWTREGGYDWIDFDHYQANIDDDITCWVVEAVFPPEGVPFDEA